MLLIIKTREEKFEEAEKKIKELHEYSVPEIIALPIIKGSEEYQRLLKKQNDRNNYR